MSKKMVAFIVLIFFAVPFASFARSPSGPQKSIETLSVTDIPDNSIVVLSQEDTGVPGYVHTKYAFNCFGALRLVDYYGSAIDPSNKEVLQFESVMCSRQQNNDYDGSND